MKSTYSILLYFAICIVSGFCITEDDDDIIVAISDGQIRGTEMISWHGRPFYAFRGIPFAKAPVGDLRFKPPVPADPWSGVLNATEDPPPCFQLELIFDFKYKGQEDCLTLNVYTPYLPSSGNPPLPVYVFIYGGAYVEGENSAHLYGPHRFLDDDLVLVLMNYRDGPQGFLSTGDAAASGNYGLLDQNLALQWVQQNIEAFGGDPNDVTLGGESAGSASVIYQILSPMSAGLFHRAIAESGSSICPWAMIDDPLFYAQALAEKMGCPTNDTTELVECLREQDPEEVYKKGLDVTVENLILAFVPVVENPESGLFLTEEPLTLLEEGRFNKVPLIQGVNRDEGCLIYYVAWPLFIEINDFFFDETLPLLLRILTDYRQNLRNVSYALKDVYYSGIDMDNDTEVVRANIDMLSDMFMRSWVVETINLIVSHDVPVYMYVFNYVGNWSFSYFTGEADVIHAIELTYLFNVTLADFNVVLNEKDSAFSEQFLGLWNNFTIRGNPTPSGPVQWTPTEFGKSIYMDINEELVMREGYYPDRMKFWIFDVPKIVYGESDPDS